MYGQIDECTDGRPPPLIPVEPHCLQLFLTEGSWRMACVNIIDLIIIINQNLFLLDKELGEKRLKIELSIGINQIKIQHKIYSMVFVPKIIQYICTLLSLISTVIISVYY